jgi:hypothetical protein
VPAVKESPAPALFDALLDPGRLLGLQPSGRNGFVGDLLLGLDQGPLKSWLVNAEVPRQFAQKVIESFSLSLCAGSAGIDGSRSAFRLGAPCQSRPEEHTTHQQDRQEDGKAVSFSQFHFCGSIYIA